MFAMWRRVQGLGSTEQALTYILRCKGLVGRAVMVLGCANPAFWWASLKQYCFSGLKRICCFIQSGLAGNHFFKTSYDQRTDFKSNEKQPPGITQTLAAANISLEFNPS